MMIAAVLTGWGVDSVSSRLSRVVMISDDQLAIVSEFESIPSTSIYTLQVFHSASDSFIMLIFEKYTIMQ